MGRTAYLNAAVALQAAPDLELSTGVAVAFPRSPFVTTAAAWELQEATGGKFRSGLGTQVHTHVVRRYGMAFDQPGPRLRDYVRAVKACFSAFRTGTLEHHGQFYDLDFITPPWSAGPIDAPDPKSGCRGGESMDAAHGRRSRRRRVHPSDSRAGYLSRHALPNIAEGAAKAGWSASDIAVIVPVLTIVGDNDAERDEERQLVRVSMSYYDSTPNYAFIWDEAGFEGTTARIRERQKDGDFAGMAAQMTDDHIAAFATESCWDGLADALMNNYDGIATRLVLYNALNDPQRAERYGEVARRMLE